MTCMDIGGRTPLHYAALEGDVDRVTRLLAEGLDPNASDAQGFVPLQFAAQEYHPEVVEILLRGGARVDA